MKLKVVTVKRSGWGKDYLRDSSSHRKCCLGFCAVEAGVKGLTGVGLPDELEGDGEYEKFLKMFPKLTIPATQELASINDSTSMTRPQKEIALNAAAKKYGVQFKFIF